MLTVYTFGDSILDSGRYNDYGVHAGQLLVRNDDRLFPEFRGNDLSERMAARLEHRAVDGATIVDLPSQLRGMAVSGEAIGILTVGGNDLLTGLLTDRNSGVAAFESQLDAFVERLPIQHIYIGNVYDPTFGDDANDFTGVDPALARDNYQQVNAAIARVARRYGTLVDLHAHFLTGDPSWYSHTIEPSLRGASEVRRCFLVHILDALAIPT